MSSRTAILTVFLILCQSVSGADEESGTPTWLTDFESAKKESGKTGKPILIEFTGSDWCIPCIRLEKQVFKKEPFISFAQQKLILLYCDLPFRKKISKEQKAHNEALAKQYKAEVYPVILLVDSAGKSLLRMDGYRGAPGETIVEEIRRAMAKHEGETSK